MERRLHHLALLLGLLAWAAAAATTGAEVCDPSIIATQIALFCMPTAPFCEPIIASVDLGGGIPCLCRVAAQPKLVLARLNATHLLACPRHLAAACQGPSPLAATVPVIASRHKQLTREAPPPLPVPRSEKLSPSPQQQPGGAAARGKAISTSPPAASSQLAPATAPTMLTPPHSGDENPIVVGVVLLGIIATVVIIIG